VGGERDEGSQWGRRMVEIEVGWGVGRKWTKVSRRGRLNTSVGTQANKKKEGALRKNLCGGLLGAGLGKGQRGRGKTGLARKCKARNHRERVKGG